MFHFKKLLISFIFIFLFTSCAGFSYPEHQALTIGRSVYIVDTIDLDCVPIETVYGTITNSDINTAVKNSFNMARNKAAKLGANVIRYKETDYHKVPFSHGLEIEFDSYYCQIGQKNSNKPYEVASNSAHSKSYQSASQSASFMASQAAMQAASQAAMSSAMSAAASAAASSASMMHMMP